eukprot:m.122656 g.122656  ORF g.122656 m.122656 type:complete len:768 (-) comp15655_c0_seq3:189-2492(-)
MWESSMVYGSSDDLPEEHAAVVDALRSNIMKENFDVVVEQAIMTVLHQDPNNIKTTAFLKEMTKILVLGRDPRGITTREAEQELRSQLKAGRWQAGLATTQVPCFIQYLTSIAQARPLPMTYPVVLYGLDILTAASLPVLPSIKHYATVLCSSTTYATGYLTEAWFQQPDPGSPVFDVLRNALQLAPKQHQTVLAACAKAYPTQPEQVHIFLLTWLRTGSGDGALGDYQSEIFQRLIADIKPAVTPAEAQLGASAAYVLLGYLPCSWPSLLEHPTLQQRLFSHTTRVLVSLQSSWPALFQPEDNSTSHTPVQSILRTTPNLIRSDSPTSQGIESEGGITTDRARSQSMRSDPSTPVTVEGVLALSPGQPRLRATSFHIGTPDSVSHLGSHEASTDRLSASDDPTVNNPAMVLARPVWRLLCLLYTLFPSSMIAYLRDLQGEQAAHRTALLPLLQRLQLNPMLTMPKSERLAHLKGQSSAEVVEMSLGLVSNSSSLLDPSGAAATTAEVLFSQLQQVQQWALLKDLRHQLRTQALELEAQTIVMDNTSDTEVMVSEACWNEFRETSDAKMAVMRNRIQQLQETNEKLAQTVSLQRHRAASSNSAPGQPELEQLREENQALKATIKKLSTVKASSDSSGLSQTQLAQAFTKLDALDQRHAVHQTQLGRQHMLETEVASLTAKLKAAESRLPQRAQQPKELELAAALESKGELIAKLQAQLRTADEAATSSRQSLLQRCTTLEVNAGQSHIEDTFTFLSASTSTQDSNMR